GYAGRMNNSDHQYGAGRPWWQPGRSSCLRSARRGGTGRCCRGRADASRGRGRPVSEEELATVQADFPGYRIWREVLPGPDRYVVWSLLPGLSPHTVVTDDLSELRGLLEPARAPRLEGFTTARANVARMYAHWLGGKDTFEA